LRCFCEFGCHALGRASESEISELYEDISLVALLEDLKILDEFWATAFGDA